MAPVKHKKRPAPKSSRPIAEATPAVCATASSATVQVDPSPASEAISSAGLPPPLTAMDVADQLHSAAIHLLRRLRVRDRESGIGPAQLSALSVLVFGGPRSLGELADAEQVRPPTMSRIVAGLERAGLVNRRKTEDGRRVRLEASARGTKILQEGRLLRYYGVRPGLGEEGTGKNEPGELSTADMVEHKLGR